MIDYKAPFSADAEAGVLGCVLLAPNALDTINLGVDSFFEDRNRTVFARMLKMRRERTAIDVLTLCHDLRSDGELEKVGGLTRINELCAAVPSAANLPYYLDIVQDMHRRRRLIETCIDVARSVQSNHTPTDTLIEDAEVRLTSALSSPVNDAPSVSWPELVGFNPDSDPNCLVGFSPDGKATRYLCRGYGAWLLGPSGIGKSSLALLFAASFAIGRPIWGIRPARPLRVLVVQAENDIGDLSEQARGISDGLGLAFGPEEDLLSQNLQVTTCTGKVGASWCQWLKAKIIAFGAEIVLVDPLLSFAGIDVSRQDQCSQFLRVYLQPILAQTGACLLSVHHTGKPKQEKPGHGAPTSVYDKMYAGLGSSELVNWARAVLLIEPAGDNAFRLTLAKRGKRAWAVHPSGEPTSLLWLKHAQSRIFWEQAEPPEELPEQEAQRPKREPKPPKQSKVQRIASMNLAGFLRACPAEGEGLREIVRRLDNWLCSDQSPEQIDVSQSSLREVVQKMVGSGKLTKKDDVYRKGPNA